MTAIAVKHADKKDLLTETFIAAEAVSSADPAANAEATLTVPAGERWLVKSVSIQMVQGATQTPWPRLVIDDGTNTLFQAQAGTAAAASSTTEQVTWAPGLLTTGPLGATTAVSRQGGLPDGLVLEAGSRIQTNTVGIGANTNYGKMWALVHKLPV